MLGSGRGVVGEYNEQVFFLGNPESLHHLYLLRSEFMALTGDFEQHLDARQPSIAISTYPPVVEFRR